MKHLQKRVLTLLFMVTFVVSAHFYYTPEALAASVSSHVRIVGTEKTIWYGDVTIDGCSITDNNNVVHTFTQPVGICVLDAAAEKGNFTYVVKDFGGSLGLFVDAISQDAGTADFSTYWLYDVNGTPASVGIANYTVKDEDSLYFHFENSNADVNKRSLNDGIAYLRSQQETTGGITGFGGVSSWAVMSFVAADIDPATVAKNNTSLLDYLVANPPASNAATTEWERDILAITAAGENPYTFGGKNYVAKLESFANNGQLGAETQINDDMFGLLALIAAGDGASDELKQDVLNFILANQQADGGFSWSTTGTVGIDDTAAALQALVAAQEAGMSASDLASGITKAKDFILVAQNSDGGFPYVAGEASNASSTAWALMAVNALDITGDVSDKAKAYLRNSQEENGSFRWQTGTPGETFTTSYAVHALTGSFWPVTIFTDVTPSPTVGPINIPTVTVMPSPTIAPTGIPTPDLRSHYREQIQQFREEQRRFIHDLREQIQREIHKILERIRIFWQK